MNRRSFLKLPIVAAPWVITTPGLLMPIRKPWKGGFQLSWTEYPSMDLDMSMITIASDIGDITAFINGVGKILCLTDSDGKVLNGGARVQYTNSDGYVSYTGEIQVVDGLIHFP